jgi:hypothetical protein
MKPEVMEKDRTTLVQQTSMETFKRAVILP